MVESVLPAPDVATGGDSFDNARAFSFSYADSRSIVCS
jgi:hypothetical protein